MIGAIIGDMIGSPYEFSNIKTKTFPLLSPHSIWTDDSLMTIAMAQAIWQAKHTGALLQAQAAQEMRRMAASYPHPTGGYGARFSQWLRDPGAGPYGSFGNGAAMRVSPCAEAAASLKEALALARQSAATTHDHPEGVKGAQAVAAAIYLARAGKDKDDIRAYVRKHFYPLQETVAQLRPTYVFDETCQGTVPQALTAFLESESFEDAARTAVSLGGDCDTLTSIACAVAWPYYAQRKPEPAMNALAQQALARLPASLAQAVRRWEKQYGNLN